MKISKGINSPVQQIKERLSIEEVISKYLKLEKAGSNLKAKCPFHNEKTASFFISPSRNSYYCFGCGAKGDIFTFVQEFEGLDFKGALKVLANSAGVVLEKFDLKTESEKERLYLIMQTASDFFSQNLKKEAKVLAYLKERGLSEKSIQDFNLGYVHNEWRSLFSYLKNKNFKEAEMEKAGLIKKIIKEGEKQESYYDRFRGRIIFPITDSSGRIVAFTGRLFDEKDEKSAKYLNSPETPIFSKSSVFYGLNKAKEIIRKNNFSILVEGQFDLILAHQAGFRNTIATSGTALSDATFSKENIVSNLGLIYRLSKNIILAFDADKAGISASERASKIILSLGMDVKVASLPEGSDPADVISKQGGEAWKKAIKDSKHIIEFLLDRILKNNQDDNRKIGRLVKEKILPYVNSLESSIEQNHFLKKISDLSFIEEKALKEDLVKIQKESNLEEETENKKENVLIFRKDYILKRLLGLILWQEKENNFFFNLKKELAIFLKIDFDILLDNFKENKEDLIFEAEFFYQGHEKLEKEAQELFNNFKGEYLKEDLALKMKDLQKMEQSKDEKNVQILLKEINEINKKIQDIKNI